MLARTFLLALLLAATALMVGACGDDDGDGGSASDDGGATAAQSDDTAADDDAEPAGEPETTLTASVGPGFDISLKEPSGADVTTLPAGTYTIAVEDLSSSHNFHLTGGDVDESTSVSEETTTTWTVELTPGEYTFVCDPHESSMKGEFTVI